MVIQWYPGHMTKAIRMMEKEVKLIDVIIYVLDARAPFSSVNPKFTKLIGDKPIIYVLNKSDMADPDRNAEWFEYFTKKSGYVVMLNSRQSNASKKIESMLNKILQIKAERYKDRGITPSLRAMVLGVPNSGKSTLINNLSGKSKTVTGNRPGVTKGKQWVRLQSGVEIMDTPGTLWPAFDNNKVAKHLAYVGSIKEEVLDIPNLSIEFINDIIAIDENILKNRYNIKFDKNIHTPVEILEKICFARGFKLRGSDFDYDRGATTLINEFKSGLLGNITLESVKDINKLLVNDRMNEKAEKEKQRKLDNKTKPRKYIN